MEKNNQIINHIPAEKFRFIHEGERITDKKFDDKPIGYFKDAWIRFRKSKASVVAAIIIIASKYISLASISGAVVYPIITGILMAADGNFLIWNEVFATIFAIIVIAKHYQNIGRLIKGTESKISIGGKKKKEESSAEK